MGNFEEELFTDPVNQEKLIDLFDEDFEDDCMAHE